MKIRNRQVIEHTMKGLRRPRVIGVRGRRAHLIHGVRYKKRRGNFYRRFRKSKAKSAFVPAEQLKYRRRYPKVWRVVKGG